MSKNWKLWSGGREVAVGLREGVADVVRDRALLALLGVLGAVQDVGLGSLELAGGLQRQLDRVLDGLDRRLAAPRRHDVDHAQRELGHGRVRLASEGGEAAADGALDAAGIEGHDPPVALDDRLGQHDLVGQQRAADIVGVLDDAALSEGEIELGGLDVAVGDAARGVHEVHQLLPESGSRCQGPGH